MLSLHSYEGGIMLYIKIKNFLYDNRYALFLLFSLFLYTTDAYAVFDSANNALNTIFVGLKKIIYPAATIGIASVCIAGMFGSFNWKWFIAILLGVFIITYASGVQEIATADLGGEG